MANPAWELYDIFEDWQQADNCRLAILNESSRVARIKHEGHRYLLEWKKIGRSSQ